MSVEVPFALAHLSEGSRERGFEIGVSGSGGSGQTMSAVQVVARDSAAAPWSGPIMVDATAKRVERLVGSKRNELAALDDEFFGEVVGVAQAIDALRTALTQISAALDSRQFEKASAIGYGKVAEEFVFLQRTLGGLQGACLHKEKLVSDLAFALRCPYEDASPARLGRETMNPKPIEEAKSPLLARTLPALLRARKRAEALAAATNTAVVDLVGGKIVHVRPRPPASGPAK